MVWEQSCELVIMLTEVVENGKVFKINNVCVLCILALKLAAHNCMHVVCVYPDVFNPPISPNFFIRYHQVRCCQYWPEKGSTKDYGKFQVMTELEQVDRVYITRRFKLRNNLVSVFIDSAWHVSKGNNPLYEERNMNTSLSGHVDLCP